MFVPVTYDDSVDNLGVVSFREIPIFIETESSSNNYWNVCCISTTESMKWNEKVINTTSLDK